LFYLKKKLIMKGATRLIGFDKPTVWTKFSQLAIKTNSINLVSVYFFIFFKISTNKYLKPYLKIYFKKIIISIINKLFFIGKIN
jgi:hypothetical protein